MSIKNSLISAIPRQFGNPLRFDAAPISRSIQFAREETISDDTKKIDEKGHAEVDGWRKA